MQQAYFNLDNGLCLACLISVLLFAIIDSWTIFISRKQSNMGIWMMNHKTVLFESSNWKCSYALYFSTEITLVSLFKMSSWQISKDEYNPSNVCEEGKTCYFCRFRSINLKKHTCFHQWRISNTFNCFKLPE